MAKITWLLLLLLFTPLTDAGQLRVAVASNFAKTLEQLALLFKQQHGHDLRISHGSTGQLFAQLRQGAPHDVFMAADTTRPQRLVTAGLATDMRVYARGQLVLLVNHQPAAQCADWLNQPGDEYLALANPELAPYGLAAREYLVNQQLDKTFSGRLVMGENVAQAAHLVISGNARGGLLAASLLHQVRLPETSCTWLIPPAEHHPVRQGMVAMTGSERRALIDEFYVFMQSAQARELMIDHGYLMAAEDD